MTQSANGVGTGGLLKRDVRGRVQSTLEHRQAVLAEFERSGLSGPQFARAAGIPYQTFASWRQRLREPREVGGSPPEEPVWRDKPRTLRLIEAAVAAGPAGPSRSGAAVEHALEVLLPGGARMLVATACQATLAAEVIQALARPC